MASDRTRQARCLECYEALHAGCRSAELTRLPVERQLWTLTQLVSAYACSAREAHVRSALVLSNLRSALEPIALAQVVPVEALIQRATADYYGAYPH